MKAQGFITHSFIEHLYNTFRIHKPFQDFPDSVDVDFEIVYNHDCIGEYTPEPHRILISTKYCKTLEAVIYTVLHEMIHMRMYLDNPKSEEYVEHNKKFDAYNKQVCAMYFLDPQEL